ncbi:MAG: hypothetical protein QM533_10180 [Cytophagales bacterium]|nr:hypothetical protein [Cytophagales bacterium]
MKTAGLFKKTQDEMSVIVKELSDNSGSLTTTRPNNELPVKYKLATADDVEYYKAVSARTAKILDESNWE